MNALRFTANALTLRPGAPWCLDLFCGAGGAAMGYWQAGFNVVGVDIAPQPHYPFWFIRGDALEVGAEIGRNFDLIHASPPCQGYSEMKHFTDGHYPKLIAEIRSILQVVGKPYIIENVRGAARDLHAPIVLCGSMFHLKTYRHRYFEVSPWILSPGHERHTEHMPQVGTGISAKNGFVTITGSGGKRIPRTVLEANNCETETDYLRAAMGISWMNRDELAESIPPAYTHYIGTQMMRIIREKIACDNGILSQ